METLSLSNYYSTTSKEEEEEQQQHHHYPTTSNNTRVRRLKRRPPARTKPLSHDRLVVVFLTASALFSLVTIFPFLSGELPSNGHNDKDWLHKLGDGRGGVLLNLAENKTLLLWHHILGRQRHQVEWGSARKKRQRISIINRTNEELLPLARGVSGLPLSKTPALFGAQHGSIQCSSSDGAFQIDELAYWNDPQGDRDVSFISPFNPQLKEKRYVTFEPDRGGWNNIRMSLEIVIVFAAATGRTLVLPPDTPFYLLSQSTDGTKRKQHHGFADFIDLENVALRNKLEIISMTEFLESAGGSNKKHGHKKMFKIPGGSEGKTLLKSAEQCYYIAKSDRSCDAIYGFLRSHAYIPDLQAGRDCLIFDSENKHSSKTRHSTDSQIFDSLPRVQKGKVKEFCDKRNPIFYRNELASAPWVHFHAGEKHHRLLSHFYTFLYFTDTKVDHYYKRFVRDFLHYGDEIYCAAGKVIRALEQEAKLSGSTDEPLFSSMHVRRGDFQYKKVKITAQDWYNITKELFHRDEIIYIATDEKSLDFFEPLGKHYNLRFLSDFSDTAGLKNLDPNFMGMIDTIVASRGRIFVGTWFSTFTGYINRMRGYYGMPGSTSYYSTPERKFNTHSWVNPHKVMTAREWPTAWVGIDGDEDVRKEREL